MRLISRTGLLIWMATAVALMAASMPAAETAARHTGPWNMADLKKVPAAEWGEKSSLDQESAGQAVDLQEVYYEGEPLAGRPTRVFAYYARPASGEGRLPGMVLVHGGGGTAFAEWATLWARRGYAALAMDLAGCGPEKKRLADGGPDQGHPEKFAPFTDDSADQMWTYHAVAAVVRGHSLLASLEGIDPERIGITGISWGGYLTCIVAGIDDRLKVAVPVYGCGFLDENSAWFDLLQAMPADQRNRWIAYFDPSRYLGGVSCPILFVNGTNDFAYPLDSYQKSYRQVPGRVDLRIEVAMRHSHPHGWAPREIGLFVDSVLTGGDPLPKLGLLKTAEGRVSATIDSKVPVVEGHIHYTTDGGKWQDRVWHTLQAELAGERVAADLPGERPIVYYLSVTDERGAMVSTEHAELPSEAPSIESSRQR
jgi:dienelactone hydrolase